MPKRLKEWLEIEESWNDILNFPHCVGALDGKHIVLQSQLTVDMWI